jgi:hypothetical protein
VPEGLEEAREAFAQEVAPESKPRDQAGRFVAVSSKPEPIFQPRPVEGGDDGDTSDGGADPRLVAQERRVANGWDQQGTDARVSNAKPDDPGAAAEGRGEGTGQDQRQGPGPGEADNAGGDDEKPDEGAAAEGPPVEDAGPRYKIEVDGQEQEVTLSEALRGYQREATFNQRMSQMVEVAKAIDARGAEAVQARDAYIQMMRREEEDFRALIPKEPANWDELYKSNPSAAHELEKNFRHVYGTLNGMQQRRAAAEAEAHQDNVRRTAEYARTQFNQFCGKNRLANQVEVDKAIASMRRTAVTHGFSEDEIGTTYDERMLSVLWKAARYDNMMANKPFPVQPDRGMQPGHAPRVGDNRGRQMNDAQKRLASSGRIDDAAAVMAQLIRR